MKQLKNGEYYVRRNFLICIRIVSLTVRVFASGLHGLGVQFKCYETTEYRNFVRRALCGEKLDNDMKNDLGEII
jgi:hypothetical protein